MRAVEQNVQVDIEVVFNQNATEPIPENNDIVQALKDAAVNPASGFNLSVDVNSIMVISKGSVFWYLQWSHLLKTATD